ncbi:MAG: peptidylprolyl isomerase [Methylocystis sp.]|nr:peptidylprolyl isomerase [Methylocystis sp.]MCA3588631.1 peptidylprolyl isomerase [Methylocystis sp.]MCA3591821.1 peptidylprolyl isomerase [Methylocystis sp.]
MMSIRPRLAAGVLAFALLSGAAFAQDSKVIARVDGSPITEEDLKIALEELGPSLPQQLDAGQRRTYAIDYLIDLKIVAAQAAKDKMADTEDFKKRLGQTRERLLMEALLTREGEKGASDEAMKKFYDETVKGLKPAQEVKARHILVEKEEEAKAALARIKKGEDFAKLAAELSKDPGSGKEGGDLGWFEKERMVPEFAEAAFKLPKGGVSEIVKTQFGYHIIQVEDIREKAPPPYDAVKEQLRRYMVQKSQQDLVLKLREAAKVEKVEEKK